MAEIFEADPDYENIKKELEPFITKITRITGKYTPEYRRFKKNVHEWKKRFTKTVELAGMVESIQKLQIPQGKSWKPDLKTADYLMSLVCSDILVL